MIPIFIGNSLFTSGNHKEAFFIRKVGRRGGGLTSLGGGGVIILKKKRHSALSKYAGMWQFCPLHVNYLPLTPHWTSQGVL